MHYVGSNTVAAGLSIHVGGARGGCVGKGGAGWDQYHSVPSPQTSPPPSSAGALESSIPILVSPLPISLIY